MLMSSTVPCYTQFMQLVGILNITPDSFSDGGVNLISEHALKNAKELFSEGADLLDVGAESTNPKSKTLAPEEEQARLKDILPQLLSTYPGKISIDTYHPETLEWALKAGQPIVNDVSGLAHKRMQELVAEHELTCIIGHLPIAAKGLPIVAHTVEPIDSIEQIRDELLERTEELIKFGIHRDKIILDPNIGFGKTMRLNWQLLAFANQVPDFPIMIGHSRKRFLGCNPETGAWLPNGQELRFTDAINQKAAQIANDAGAAYLRVHEPRLYFAMLN